jgi:antirestriction protein ArdC
MGNAFLCAQARIEKVTIENSAAYIANWLQVLKADVKMVVIAVAQAQKASDYILDRKFED